jgi:hypothetical protein
VDRQVFVTIAFAKFIGLKPYSSIPGMENLNAVAIAVKVAMEKLRPTLPPDVPELLKELIVQCWAAEATDRPSIEEVVESLSKMEVVDNKL